MIMDITTNDIHSYDAHVWLDEQGVIGTTGDGDPAHGRAHPDQGFFYAWYMVTNSGRVVNFRINSDESTILQFKLKFGGS